ncbi:MAG: ester cyclase [Chloroflexota bacterium]
MALSKEKSEDLMRRFSDALNRNEVGVNHEFWTADMVWRGNAGLGVKHGVDQFEQEIREPFIRAFPDKVSQSHVRFMTAEYAAAAGYQLTTFAEDWLGIPATGEQMKVPYIDIWSIVEDEDGEPKFHENWVMIDILSVLEQAGYDVEKVLKFVGSKPPAFFDDVE